MVQGWGAATEKALPLGRPPPKPRIVGTEAEPPVMRMELFMEPDGRNGTTEVWKLQ